MTNATTAAAANSGCIEVGEQVILAQNFDGSVNNTQWVPMLALLALYGAYLLLGLLLLEVRINFKKWCGSKK